MVAEITIGARGCTTMNNQLTDDGLSLLISKLDKALSECINHGFTDSAEEYADMINALRELEEHRKAASAPIYQLFDMGWYDTDKQTYDSVTGAGCAGRIVYAAPQSLSEAERAELQEHRKANQASVKQCPKCGDRGTYYSPQMRGSVFCECALEASAR